MKLFTAAALGAALLSAPLSADAKISAPSGEYVLDPTHANVVFQVTHMGLSPYTARFDKLDAKLVLDVENPQNSSVTATVDVGSVSTNYSGDKDFNGEIAFNEKFLNGKAFPKIEFASKKVTQTSETTATIIGELTMLGVTKEISLDAELTGSLAAHPFIGKPAVGFVATGVIDRTAWGFTHLTSTMPQIDPKPIVSPEVTILIQAEFLKAD